MSLNEREKASQRIFLGLILGLLLAYGGLKSWHVAVAIDAYQGQPLERTIGAAK